MEGHRGGALPERLPGKCQPCTATSGQRASSLALRREQVRVFTWPAHSPALVPAPATLTLEVELLNGVARGLVLALVVGQRGLLEHHPVLAVPLQGQLPGPEGTREVVTCPLSTPVPSSRTASFILKLTGRSGDCP